MPSVITNLCLRDGACVTVCPVDCIVPGNPVEQWSQYYIDPGVCIDCGKCIPECPHGAIYPIAEVPSAFTAKGGERLSMPFGTTGFSEVYERLDHNGNLIHLEATRTLLPDEIIDLTPSIERNLLFFEGGPGYDAI